MGIWLPRFNTSPTLRGRKGKSLRHQFNSTLQEELHHHNRLFGGRQYLLMVAQAFVTAANTETYLGTGHLATLDMVNNDLDTFWMCCEQTVGQFPPQSILPKGLQTVNTRSWPRRGKRTGGRQQRLLLGLTLGSLTKRVAPLTRPRCTVTARSGTSVCKSS